MIGNDDKISCPSIYYFASTNAVATRTEYKLTRVDNQQASASVEIVRKTRTKSNKDTTMYTKPASRCCEDAMFFCRFFGGRVGLIFNLWDE